MARFGVSVRLFWMLYLCLFSIALHRIRTVLFASTKKIVQVIYLTSTHTTNISCHHHLIATGLECWPIDGDKCMNYIAFADYVEKNLMAKLFGGKKIRH